MSSDKKGIHKDSTGLNTSSSRPNHPKSRYRVRFGNNVFEEIMMEYSKQEEKEIRFVNSNAEEFQ